MTGLRGKDDLGVTVEDVSGRSDSSCLVTPSKLLDSWEIKPFDAEWARAMATACTGADLTLALGAKTSNLHGESLEVSGRVGHVHHGPLAVDNWSGRSFDFGSVGVLEVGGVQVVVTERRMVTENVDIFEALGLDVRQLQMAGFKGLGLHVRQALAGKIRALHPGGCGRRHPPRRAQARPLPAPAPPLLALRRSVAVGLAPRIETL